MRGVAILVIAAACSSGGQHDKKEPPVTPPTTPPATSPDAPPAPASEGWSATVDGIRIKLAPPAPTARAGATIALGLVVENTGDRPRRIYLLGPEVFRATMSDLTVLGADGTPVGMSQPEPHPHGYLPTEADFPLIAAHATATFSQSLALDAGLAPGPITVRWDYENRVTKMAGGVQTLDGPTKPLFGGGEIPDIWVGELTATAPLTIVK